MAKINRINFTINSLEGLPIPEKGIITYKDIRQPALSIYITSNGVKTFFVRKRIKGRDERLIIGRFPTIKIEQARAKAAVFCGIIAERKDPMQELKKERLDRITFEEHFHDYMERYSKLHKSSWKYDQDQINRHVSHWFKRRLSDITKDDVSRLHEKIGRDSGKVQANAIVRRLAAILIKPYSGDGRAAIPHWVCKGLRSLVVIGLFNLLKCHFYYKGYQKRKMIP